MFEFREKSDFRQKYDFSATTLESAVDLVLLDNDVEQELFADLFGCRRMDGLPQVAAYRPAGRQPRPPGNLLPDRTTRRARRGLPGSVPAQALFRH
jgi:hypothetical protein